MLLVIQIPCLNEEATLPKTLAALPQQIEGIDSIEVLVIDDGSTDRTSEVARMCGVQHIVRNERNRGLAYTFARGLRVAVQLGADIIVNTDADNQYFGGDIPELVRPLLEKRAQIVVGARPISEIESFSPLKKRLQKLGSWVVRLASSTDVPDAPSGFRAFTREAAIQMNVFSSYSYTLETLIQAGQKNIPITWVPVRVNAVERPSRLFKSMSAYVRRSALTTIRIFIVYRPLRFFTYVSLLFAIPGLLIFLRFLYHFAIGQGAGYVQSLMLGVLLVALAGLSFLAGILADLIAVNRLLLEQQRSDLLQMSDTFKGVVRE